MILISSKIKRLSSDFYIIIKWCPRLCRELVRFWISAKYSIKNKVCSKIVFPFLSYFDQCETSHVYHAAPYILEVTNRPMYILLPLPQFTFVKN